MLCNSVVCKKNIHNYKNKFVLFFDYLFKFSSFSDKMSAMAAGAHLEHQRINLYTELQEYLDCEQYCTLLCTLPSCLYYGLLFIISYTQYCTKILSLNAHFLYSWFYSKFHCTKQICFNIYIFLYDTCWFYSKFSPY